MVKTFKDHLRNEKTNNLETWHRASGIDWPQFLMSKRFTSKIDILSQIAILEILLLVVLGLDISTAEKHVT